MAENDIQIRYLNEAAIAATITPLGIEKQDYNTRYHLCLREKSLHICQIIKALFLTIVSLGYHDYSRTLLQEVCWAEKKSLCYIVASKEADQKYYFNAIRSSSLSRTYDIDLWKKTLLSSRLGPEFESLFNKALLDDELIQALILSKNRENAISSMKDCLNYHHSDSRSDYRVIFNSLSNDIKEDKPTLIQMIKDNKDVYCLISDNLKKDKDILAIFENYEYFYNFSENLKGCKEIALIFVNKDGSQIRSASEKLRNDKELAKIAIQQNPDAYAFISKELQKDPDILGILDTAFSKGLIWWYNLNNIRQMKDISIELVLLAVKYTGANLANMPQYLKDNKEVAKTALKNYHGIFSSLSETLRKDPEILEIIKDDTKEMTWYVQCYNREAFHSASERLKIDPDFLMLYYGTSPEEIKKWPESLTGSEKAMLYAVRRDGMNLQYGTPDIQNNPKIVLEAMKQNFNAYEFASTTLQKSSEILNFFDKFKNGNWWLFEPNRISKYLLSVKEVVLILVKFESYGALYNAPETIQKDKDILDIVKNDPKLDRAFIYLAKEDQDNPELALRAVTNGLEVAQFTESMKDNEDLVKISVKRDRRYLPHATQRVQDLLKAEK